MIHSRAYTVVSPEECAAILAVHAEGIENYRVGGSLDGAVSTCGERLRYSVKHDGKGLFCHCCDSDLRPGQRYAVILVGHRRMAYWVRVCGMCGAEARVALRKSRTSRERGAQWTPK